MVAIELEVNEEIPYKPRSKMENAVAEAIGFALKSQMPAAVPITSSVKVSRVWGEYEPGDRAWYAKATFTVVGHNGIPSYAGEALLQGELWNEKEIDLWGIKVELEIPA